MKDYTVITIKADSVSQAFNKVKNENPLFKSYEDVTKKYEDNGLDLHTFIEDTNKEAGVLLCICIIEPTKEIVPELSLAEYDGKIRYVVRTVYNDNIIKIESDKRRAIKFGEKYVVENSVNVIINKEIVATTAIAHIKPVNKGTQGDWLFFGRI